MNRSIYSLALTDAVVEAVDRKAQEMGTSRSNLVNKILAEYLQYEMPEVQIERILCAMAENMEGQIRLFSNFRDIVQSSRALSVQTTIPFRYSPTAQYALELYREPADGEDGCLKVTVRTQNPLLRQELEQFYRLWAEWESRFVRRRYGIKGSCMLRSLRIPDDEEESFGDLAAEYIRLLDTIMKRYLRGEQDLENGFIREMSRQPFII